MSNEKYKLHPVTAIINVVKALKDLLIPIVIIIVANGFNFNLDYRSETFFSEMIPLFILVIVVFGTMVSGLIKWWTFVYWYEDSELRVEYGLFVKKKRYIPFDRIQNLNYKEGIFHRLFKLVQVQVETAGSKSGKPEAELTAVTRAAADDVEIQMKKAKQKTPIESELMEVVEEEEAPSTILHKMKVPELLLLASTSSGIGVVLAGVFAVFSQFAEFIPFDAIYDEVAFLMEYSFIAAMILIALALMVAWIISVGITFLNYYNFTVSKQQNRLIITRGLIEKKRVTIPLNRVQAIKLVENPFQQMLGLASIAVESAGGGFSGEADKKIILFPLIAKKEALKPLAELFPEYDFHLSEAIQPPKKALPFFYRIDFIWLVPLIAAISYFFYPFGLLSLLLVLPILLLGRWQFKTTGYTIEGQQITIVSRMISRVTFFALKKRVQVTQGSQTYFQKRRKIGSAKIIVMSGMAGASATVRHIDQKEVEKILTWYEY
ncbi:PH domain-containing protein [Solibacillus sp. A46]|uniref:PH domain-containing protein n=1 Tax=Solibacillus faecavium TaxID=2762221 RepID=A0ABR8Y255_9BACL|nr:PH domain-containing protein [Solibacillus faecavium]MBD8038286.1 PH domain-containing protein [Solibacillus faecavium]